MNKKYRCPNPQHDDSTPSAHAYHDGFHCYGCGARGPLSALGLKDGERPEIVYVEDIDSTIADIKSLPRKEIRGFSLHCNSRGYYLIWPSKNYYKLRVEGAEAGSKYRGPSGHSKPPFIVSEGKGDHLVLVEGEFNALSLGALEPPFDIISPGGAGDFYSKRGQKDLERYSRYGRIDVIVDADAAGAQAAIETKARLVTLGCPDVRLFLVEKDFNQILCDSGKEALREEATRLGLY